jgi:restriction system protein
MQFKDAAYEILKQGGEPLHYNEITEQALEAGLLSTSGQTPHASMGSLLYTDTLKDNSRFRRGDVKGTFALRTKASSDIQKQIEAINTQVCRTLRKRLLQMEPRQFEKLIKHLMDEMGLVETSVTSYGGDGGIDVRGILNAENLSQITVAVQAKRWKANVGAKVVRELRGSIRVHEHGIIITPSDFTAAAKSEAEETGKVRISLINGSQLVDLLIDHQVGVANQEHVVQVVDEDYWDDILGEDRAQPTAKSPTQKTEKASTIRIKLPLPIQAKYKGQVFQAELLDIGGKVRYDGVLYETPSTAAKVVATSWKAVNGWDFWKYVSQETGKLLKIGTLK